MPKWFYFVAAAFALAGVVTAGPTFFLDLKTDDAGPLNGSPLVVTYLALGALVADVPRWVRNRAASQKR